MRYILLLLLASCATIQENQCMVNIFDRTDMIKLEYKTLDKQTDTVIYKVHYLRDNFKRLETKSYINAKYRPFACMLLKN